MEKQKYFSLLNEPVAAYGPLRIKLIRKGLQFNAIESFLLKTGITRIELANILQVSVRTLQRHEVNKRLSPAISEKLIQLNDLYLLAQEPLGTDATNTTAWLRESNVAIGNEAPIAFLDTYIGFQQVQAILGRLAHGVFS